MSFESKDSSEPHTNPSRSEGPDSSATGSGKTDTLSSEVKSSVEILHEIKKYKRAEDKRIKKLLSGEEEKQLSKPKLPYLKKKAKSIESIAVVVKTPKLKKDTKNERTNNPKVTKKDLNTKNTNGTKNKNSENKQNQNGLTNNKRALNGNTRKSKSAERIKASLLANENRSFWGGSKPVSSASSNTSDSHASSTSKKAISWSSHQELGSKEVYVKSPQKPELIKLPTTSGFPHAVLETRIPSSREERAETGPYFSSSGKEQLSNRSSLSHNSNVTDATRLLTHNSIQQIDSTALNNHYPSPPPPAPKDPREILDKLFYAVYSKHNNPPNQVETPNCSQFNQYRSFDSAYPIDDLDSRSSIAAKYTFESLSRKDHILHGVKHFPTLSEPNTSSFFENSDFLPSHKSRLSPFKYNPYQDNTGTFGESSRYRRYQNIPILSPTPRRYYNTNTYNPNTSEIDRYEQQDRFENQRYCRERDYGAPPPHFGRLERRFEIDERYEQGPSYHQQRRSYSEPPKRKQYITRRVEQPERPFETHGVTTPVVYPPPRRLQSSENAIERPSRPREGPSSQSHKFQTSFWRRECIDTDKLPLQSPPELSLKEEEINSPNPSRNQRQPFRRRSLSDGSDYRNNYRKTGQQHQDSSNYPPQESRRSHMGRMSLEDHERKVIIEFCHLLEKSKQLFNGLRELPQYGHKQWHSYFGRTFDVYTKLWKFQQQHRAILDSKYGLKRWQIGEIASKIGQLYYHFYLRTSETAYLNEAFSFYYAIRGRSYYTKACKEDKCELMVKKLRYYARFIVVSLLLKKVKLVRELLKELDRQIIEYGNTYDPDDQIEWTVVVDEVKAFIQAEPVVTVIHPDSYPIILSHRLSQLTTPPVEKTSQMNLTLQEVLIVGSSSQQVKFSELTMDMFRMLQTLEREPTGDIQHMYDDSPRQRFNLTPSVLNNKAYNLETGGPRCENPHKYLLFKPSPTQILVYLASGCNDLPPNGALLLYISADGHILPPSKHPEDIGYDIGGLITTSKTELYRESAKDPKGNQSKCKELQCFHPGDLYPFTRRPLFIIIDSDNSYVFQNIPRHFGHPMVVLMSPLELPNSLHVTSSDRKQQGSLFTMFLHSPLTAFCHICDIHTISLVHWERAQSYIDTFMTETSQIVTRSRIDVMFLNFMGDDFLRLLIIRFIFCEVVLRMHRSFRTRTQLARSSPPIPDDLLEHPALIHIVMDLASHLQVRAHFQDQSASGPPPMKD